MNNKYLKYLVITNVGDTSQLPDFYPFDNHDSALKFMGSLDFVDDCMLVEMKAWGDLVAEYLSGGEDA